MRFVDRENRTSLYRIDRLYIAYGNVMRKKFFLNRLLILIVILIIFSVCSLTLGFKNAIEFTILIFAPVFILLLGILLLLKSWKAKEINTNLIGISIPALMVFTFTYLGLSFDPRNQTPFGLTTFIFSGSIGLGIFLIGLLALAVNKFVKKQRY